MIQLIPVVVKVLGVRRLAGWALRLVQLVLLLGGGWAAYKAMSHYPLATGAILAVVLCVAVIRHLWARRGRQAETGPRTIDGKIVPDVLAAAALDVPAQSPDGDSVLRGLPDYGKVLLKLSGPEFEYLPEAVPRSAPLPALPEPEPEPEESRPWFAGVPRWAWVSGVAALLVVGVVAMTQSRERHPVRDAGLDNYLTAHASAAQAPQESAPAPLPPPASLPVPAPVAEAAPAPVPEAPPAVVPASEDKSAEAATDAKTYTDPRTGRIWQVHDNGQPVDWAGALSYCNSLHLNRGTWRVPSKEQLQERAANWDSTRSSRLPTPGTFLWSSSENAAGSSAYVFEPLESPDKIKGVHDYGRVVCTEAR